MANTRRMAQFAQRLGLDLADAFARDVIHLADFLERAFVTVEQAEAHFENFALALGQRRQHVAQFFAEQAVAGDFRGIFGGLVPR